MGFLVAKGLPFRILIGCDMLRRHTAVINLASGKVTPVSYTHLDVYKRQLSHTLSQTTELKYL